MYKFLAGILMLGVLSYAVAQADKETFGGLKEKIFGRDAEGTTAQQLVDSCRYGHTEDRKRAGYMRDQWEEGSCVGYFKGFVEALYTMGKPESVGLCIPKEFFAKFHRPEAFGDPFRSIFLGWAVRHPDQLTKPAAEVALAALIDAWPCQMAQKGAGATAKGALATQPSKPSRN